MGGVCGEERVGVQRVEEEEEEWATWRSSSRVDCVVCEEVEVGRGVGEAGMGEGSRGGGNGEEKRRREEESDEQGGGNKEGGKSSMEEGEEGGDIKWSGFQS